MAERTINYDPIYNIVDRDDFDSLIYQGFDDHLCAG